MPKYFLSLLAPILVIAGNLAGDWWVLGNIFFNLIFMVSADLLAKPNTSENNVTGTHCSVFLLLLHVILNTAAICSLIYGIQYGIITSYFIFFAAISTGFNSGISGIVTAHELIHGNERVLRILGIWNLLLVNYGHFYIEHIRGHHKYVGTPRDPATAHYGESIYAFIRRTIPQQFISAFKIEKERHSLLRNFVCQVCLIEILSKPEIILL